MHAQQRPSLRSVSCTSLTFQMYCAHHPTETAIYMLPDSRAPCCRLSSRGGGADTCYTVHTAQLKHLVTQTHQPPDRALQTVASQVGTWVYVPS